MSSIVDWLSFTLPMVLDATTDEGYKLSIERAFYDMFGKVTTDTVFAGKWDLRDKGRAPYTDTWERKDAPIVMFTSRQLIHMTVEFSGKGCQWLRDKSLLQTILEGAHTRVTRLDIASDFITPTTPSQFIEAGYSNRFSSQSIITSTSGETVYVGSQKSERFARVYRFAPPHPRCQSLRVEYVLRREQAKLFAKSLLYRPVAAMAGVLGKDFDWQHPAWSLPHETLDTPTNVRGDRSNAGTIRWLMLSVAPAFKRLVKEGEIADPEQFVRSVFLDGQS
jgi:hypothetical protein